MKLAKVSYLYKSKSEVDEIYACVNSPQTPTSHLTLLKTEAKNQEGQRTTSENIYPICWIKQKL